VLSSEKLRDARERRGWTQDLAARRLGVSQPYLALLESGKRKLTNSLAVRVARLYRLGPEALPVTLDFSQPKRADNEEVMRALGALGYPGFAFARARQVQNPAELLLQALLLENLEGRTTEALPWVLVQYPDLDWDWLVPAVKFHDLQNRLGFLVSLASQITERRGDKTTLSKLRKQESRLEQARLAKEDVLAGSAVTQAERRWLSKHRPQNARAWNLLTDLTPEHVRFAYETAF
jgi:transcriptional regulator with XRE-family HTH domain